jgi:hypothetical protein
MNNYKEITKILEDVSKTRELKEKLLREDYDDFELDDTFDDDKINDLIYSDGDYEIEDEDEGFTKPEYVDDEYDYEGNPIHDDSEDDDDFGDDSDFDDDYEDDDLVFIGDKDEDNDIDWDDENDEDKIARYGEAKKVSVSKKVPGKKKMATPKKLSIKAGGHKVATIKKDSKKVEEAKKSSKKIIENGSIKSGTKVLFKPADGSSLYKKGVTLHDTDIGRKATIECVNTSTGKKYITYGTIVEIIKEKVIPKKNSKNIKESDNKANTLALVTRRTGYGKKSDTVNRTDGTYDQATDEWEKPEEDENEIDKFYVPNKKKYTDY